MSFNEEKEWHDIENLEVTIHQLERCSNIVYGTGINASALGIMKATGLLVGTSLDTIAMESAKDIERDVAVEALQEATKTKVAEWSAKIMVFMKNTVNVTNDLISTVRAKIKATSQIIAEKSEKIFDESLAYAKAHPYKTILGVLAAAALTVAVIKFASTGAPGVDCKGSVLKSYLDKIKAMAKDIKSPFGKVTSVSGGDEVTSNLIKYTETAMGRAPTEKLNVLGWTKATFANVVRQVEGLWESFSTTMKPFWENVIKPIDKVVSNVGFFPKVVGEKIKVKTGTRAVPWLAEKVIAAVYYPIMIKLFKSLWGLVKAFVVKALEVVNTTFNGLKNTRQEA